jgi:hypothetical protein
MLHMDRRASGEDRRLFLLEHPYLGQAYEENGTLRGFALPMAGNGPVVAEHATAGLELQRWLLPVQNWLLVPSGANEAFTHLIRQGYRDAGMYTHMVRAPPPGRPRKELRSPDAHTAHLSVTVGGRYACTVRLYASTCNGPDQD